METFGKQSETVAETASRSTGDGMSRPEELHVNDLFFPIRQGASCSRLECRHTQASVNRLDNKWYALSVPDAPAVK